MAFSPTPLAVVLALGSEILMHVPIVVVHARFARRIDPELLARAQIEELVRSDPRRVGEILSRWADETPARASR